MKRLSLFSLLALVASLLGVVGAASPATAASAGESETILHVGSSGAAYGNVVRPLGGPAVYGQDLTMVAFVSDESTSCEVFPFDCDTPQGSVDFYDVLNGSQTFIANAALVPAGPTSLSKTEPINYCCPGAGEHTFRAVYRPGDFDPSEDSVSYTITKASTTTSLSQSSPSTVEGQPVTFTATVATDVTDPRADVPRGEVQFYDGPTPLGGPRLLSFGTASITVSSLSPGEHSGIQAVYRGDSNYQPSVSPWLTHTVTALAPTTTALTAGPNPAGVGQPVTFTATVASSDGTPTGTVAFREGTTTLGSGTLSGGVATFTTSGLSVGTHSITATYGGDSVHGRSTSAAVSVTVLACTITAPPSGGNTVGTAGNDVICGSSANDDIAGLGGDDIIVGGGGNDRISGGDGNDTIYGGDGGDQLSGGAGNDRLVGGAGTDYAVGGEGTDLCDAEYTATCEEVPRLES